MGMARITPPRTPTGLHLIIGMEQLKKMKQHCQSIWTKVTPLGSVGKDAKDEVIELLEELQEIENQ